MPQTTGLSQADYGNAAQAGQCKPRESQVEQQMTRIADYQKSMESMLDMLEGRLAVVLKPTQPSPEMPNQKPLDIYVQHANRLRTIAENVEGAAVRLRDLIDRLEL